MSQTTESPLRDADRLMFAGMLWLSTASVLPMIEKPNLDLAQQIGLHAFGLAIPLLAAGFVTDYARRANKTIPKWHDLLCLCGPLSCIVGFDALLFHVNFVVGIIFIVAVLVAFFVVRRLV